MPPKIQPIDIDYGVHLGREPVVRADAGKPVLKSRLRRLFDRQFPGVLRISSSEKVTGGEAPPQCGKDGGGGGGAVEFEPSSVCLAKMVQNFIEESNEKQPVAKCGRNRCNCFNGNNNDSSDDELDMFDGFAESVTNGSSGDSDALKGLIPCSSVSERNLLADTAKIVEKNKNVKRKDDLRKIVVENLSSLGYDSSICKSKWDKTSSFPAGEYEYIDAIVEGERLLIDVDFRSEFEIARSTGTYRAILQLLPYIFVGKAERLGQIVAFVSEAARQSLKKKGMHVAPWRKAEYMRARWLSPYTRASKADPEADPEADPADASADADMEKTGGEKESEEYGEFELIFGAEEPPPSPSPSPSSPEEGSGPSTGGAATGEWRPPALRPKSVEMMGGGTKVVTGLASLLKEKP